MRGLARKLPAASILLPSSSSFSSAVGGGRGRGFGRGLSPPPPSHPPHPHDPSSLPSLGHGRGAPATSSSSSGESRRPVFPSFTSPSAAAGRGRGRPLTPPLESPTPDPILDQKKPIFFTRGNPQFSDPDETLGAGGPQPDNKKPVFVAQDKPKFSDPDETLGTGVPVHVPGAGRGKPSRTTTTTSPAPKNPEPNRHARPIGRPRPVSTPPTGPVGPKLSREEAIKKAVEVLSRGGGEGRGRGVGRRGRGGGRGIGKRDEDDNFQLYLGDNAYGEKFAKRMGEERMRLVEQLFEEASWNALPSPLQDAYLDALHTNNLFEYEPEYLMGFDRNPDIDEKPPMPLEEVLQKVKPFMMAYEGIKSQEEWEEIIKDLMERLPHMKELVDMYSGPDRVTAKQQMDEFDRVAKTLPENVPSSVKRFTDRAVLSLQSNPGWGWDKKCQFMDKLMEDVSQHYK